MFGRPRRVAYWMNHPQQSMVAFGKRTAVNTTIQGTGADILKIAFIKIFNMFYSPKDYRSVVRFLNTVHDEINYNVRKDAISVIVPRLIQCMRLQLPNWEFPMEVGLSVGNRWGQSVDFDFDKTTLEILGPKKDPISDHDICSTLNIKNNQETNQSETNRVDAEFASYFGEASIEDMSITY